LIDLKDRVTSTLNSLSLSGVLLAVAVVVVAVTGGDAVSRVASTVTGATAGVVGGLVTTGLDGPLPLIGAAAAAEGEEEEGVRGGERERGTGWRGAGSTNARKLRGTNPASPCAFSAGHHLSASCTPGRTVRISPEEIEHRRSKVRERESSSTA
jgi:hypothetical protein